MPAKPAPQIDLPTATSPQVSILIATSSRTDLLLQCLDAIRLHASRKIPYEVIIVLNGTEPQTEDELRCAVRGATIVHSPVNLGLAGAANLARAQAQGEFLILLHDDTEIESGWLDHLVEAAGQEPHAGAIGSKVLRPDGSFHHLGALLWRGAVSSSVTIDDGVRRAVDFTGTCSLLVRSEVWDHIGGLDEHFYPAYYIDANMAMSVRAAGYFVATEPKSVVRHHTWASSNKLAREVYVTANHGRFVTKWHDELQRLEPRPDPVSLEAQRRRLERAESLAQEFRRHPLPSLSKSETPFDPERQRISLAIRQARMQERIADHLVGMVEAQSAEIAQLLNAVNRQSATIDDLSRRLERIMGPLRSVKRVLQRLRLIG